MSTPVLNSASNLSGKTLLAAENNDSVTGLLTFERAPSAPFAVETGSAVVTNLNADSVDGAHFASGTWTPKWGGATSESGQTYSSQNGRYVKVGTQVTAWGHLALSVLGTITGALQIEGLPFTSTSANSARGVVTFGYWSALTTSWIWIGGYVPNGGTVAPVVGRQSAGTTITALTQADLSAATDALFMIVYEASS
jgi:hypothetical protein